MDNEIVGNLPQMFQNTISFLKEMTEKMKAECELSDYIYKFTYTFQINGKGEVSFTATDDENGTAPNLNGTSREDETYTTEFVPLAELLEGDNPHWFIG